MAEGADMTEETGDVEVEETITTDAGETDEHEAHVDPEKQSHQKVELSDEDYSRAVRKRIGKEVAKRKAAEDAFNSARSQAEEAARRAEELEEKLSAIEEDRIKRAKLEKQELLREAIVEGETESQNTLMNEIFDLHAKEKELSSRREKKETKPAKVIDDPPENVTHPSAAAFMDRNEWFHTNEKASSRAMEIEVALKKEGYELGDDLYEELESRIYKEMPELDELGGGEEDSGSNAGGGAGNQQPVTTAAGRSGGRPVIKRDGKNHMSKDAQATMRRYGLDPGNAEHIKGFLKHHRGA